MIYLKLLEEIEVKELKVKEIEKCHFSSQDLDIFISYENDNPHLGSTYIRYVGEQDNSLFILEITNNKLIGISVKAFAGKVRHFDSVYTLPNIQETCIYPFVIDVELSNVASQIKLNNIDIKKDIAMYLYKDALEIILEPEVPARVIKLSSSLGLYLNDKSQLIGFYLYDNATFFL